MVVVPETRDFWTKMGYRDINTCQPCLALDKVKEAARQFEQGAATRSYVWVRHIAQVRACAYVLHQCLLDYHIPLRLDLARVPLSL